MIFGADKIPDIAKGMAQGIRKVKDATQEIKTEIKKSAEKKGIDYVWFPPFDADGVHEVKNMNTREQQKDVNPKTW